jgi:hypothetical protein
MFYTYISVDNMHRNLYEIVLKICLLVHDSKFCLSLFSVRYGLCLEGGRIYLFIIFTRKYLE